MANVDNPHGLRPIGRTLSGGIPYVQWFTKAVGKAAALCVNDAVAVLNDGTLGIATDITPGTTLYSGVNLVYGAASTATNHPVIVSPDAVFEAQDDGDTDGFALADMGLNCNLVLNAGSNMISGHELDEATINTTNSLDVHLLEKLPVVGNDYGYSNVDIIVVFNKHRMALGVAGV